MHHPGPPRFVAVGDEVELAPRDPDPAATYGWRVVEAPSSSTAAVGDDPVERLLPDAPGRYVVELTAPDGTHRQTVRAFPGHLASRPADETFASSGGVGGDGEPGILDAAGESVSGRGDPDDGDGGGRPRVRLDATVEEGAVIVRATPRPHPDSAERPVDLDVEFLLDDRDGVERGDVTVERGRLRVPTDVLSDRLRVYGVAVGTDGYSVPDAVSITRGDGDGGGGTTARITTDRPYEPPAWAGDGVIYEVYVRTFPGEDHDDGDGRSVFDVIRDRLDYIEGLGVDALWLSPVLQNDDFRHGYNVTDFFSIAADLGTREGYERLIEAAHDRGMRVLFDLVCNHTARDHPYFRAAVSDPDSDYREWYEWRGPDEPETYFDWPYIANLNFDHLPVRRHLLDAVDEWAPLVDGFRCDMAWAVPEGFWREIRDRTKAEAEEFLLLDETIPYVADFHGALFDVHFDPTVYDALRRVGGGTTPASYLIEAVGERGRAGFPDHAGFMLYAENHDESRYVEDHGTAAARAALGATFTLPGAPMVYAGQEFGERTKRDDLSWDEADERLREHVRHLADIREHDALAADAGLRELDREVAGVDPDRVVAYERTAPGGETVAVVLNFAAEPATVSVDVNAGDRDLVTGERVRTDGGLRVGDVVVVEAA